MIRKTKDNKNIEIDTYNDLNHLRNICKMIKIIGWNLLTIEECKDEINNYLENAELNTEAMYNARMGYQ